jgi:DeoR/GlpR family transcriptional regulator of sugar metabolism
MPQPLFLEERRSYILESLQRMGRVSVKDLSEHLGVSAVTIRQDLQALEEEGLLKRTYGGAVSLLAASVTQAQSEQAFEVRRLKFSAEKEAIGRAAAALVKDGYGIAMDGSTTAVAIAPYLKQYENLVIVTNSLMIAQQFVETPQIRVQMPAGRLRRDSISLVGQPETLPTVNFNVGFFGAHGLSMETGITEMSEDEALIKKALITHCLATVIVVDSSKWGLIAPYTYASPYQLERIITTQNAPAEMVKQFRSSGVVVETVALGG